MEIVEAKCRNASDERRLLCIVWVGSQSRLLHGLLLWHLFNLVCLVYSIYVS